MNIFSRQQEDNEQPRETGINQMNHSVRRYDFLESIQRHSQVEDMLSHACFGCGRKNNKLGEFNSPYPVSKINWNKY